MPGAAPSPCAPCLLPDKPPPSLLPDCILSASVSPSHLVALQSQSPCPCALIPLAPPLILPLPYPTLLSSSFVPASSPLLNCPSLDVRVLASLCQFPRPFDPNPLDGWTRRQSADTCVPRPLLPTGLFRQPWFWLASVSSQPLGAPGGEGQLGPGLGHQSEAAYERSAHASGAKLLGPPCLDTTPHPKAPVPQFWGPARRGWEKEEFSRFWKVSVLPRRLS